MIEDASLATTFSFNVKGETSFVGAVTGRITSRAGGTSRKLPLHDPDIIARIMECVKRTFSNGVDILACFI